MDGGGGDAIRDALPIPLGSLMEEFLIGGIPLMADAPAPAEPAVRIGFCWAYEPAVDASTKQSAKASFRETSDMKKLHRLKAPTAHVGARSVPTTKL
jgi:hypothetical protein